MKRLVTHVLETLQKEQSTIPDPLILTQTWIILPTERACLAFEEAFVHAQEGKSFFKPKVHSITRWSQPQNSPLKALSGSQRLFLLACFLQEKKTLSWQECFTLASSLTTFLDQCQTEEIPLAHLADLVPDHLSAHWQSSLDVLTLFSQEWPYYLERKGFLDPWPARILALQEHMSTWKASPPTGNILVAGIVGSVPSVATFLKEVTHFPKSQIIFNDLDLEMSAENWDKLPMYHPQYGLKQTLERMGYSRQDVRLLPAQTDQTPLTHRKRFLQSLFCSGRLGVTETQKDLQETQQEKTELPFGPLHLFEAHSLQEEARLIALLIRERLTQPSHTIALVTPHRALSDRVTAELKRWKIVPNDSYGESLFESSLGSFMVLSLTAAVLMDDRPQPQKIPTLLSLLKNPFTRLGLSPALCRRYSRALELKYFRKPTPFSQGTVSADDPQIKEEDISSFYKNFCQVLSLFQERKDQSASLAQWVARHRDILEKLAEEESSASVEPLSRKKETLSLWQGTRGQAAWNLFEHLTHISTPDVLLSLQDYIRFFINMVQQIRLPQTFGMHPRVHILGPLESRTLSFDTVILGGMNDHTWVHSEQSDLWLSSDMKKKLGLPDESYQAGLTALDWFSLMMAPHVCITRAQREKGVAMLPSRWLLRLKAVLKQRNHPLHTEEKQWTFWAKALGMSSCLTASPLAQRPCPKPPLQARPRRLSITDIQLWQQDPYALYVQKILKLTPLPSLQQEVNSALFGIAVHQAFERYNCTPLPRRTEEQLLAYGQEALNCLGSDPVIQTLWWPRFIRICRWFLAQERACRSPMDISWAEVKGHMVIQGRKDPFILTGKADRLICSPEGNLEILDYKTGTLPSRKMVLEGRVVQLPLEAAITLYGVWEEDAQHKKIFLPFVRLEKLSYWHVKGGVPAGQILSFDGEENIQKMAENALKNLTEYIHLFDEAQTPYEASFKGHPLYDPLSRRQEWTR